MIERYPKSFQENLKNFSFLKIIKLKTKLILQIPLRIVEMDVYINCQFE